MVRDQMVKLCACTPISDKLICHGAWVINLKFKKTAPYGPGPDGQAMRMHAHIRQADMSWGMGYKFEV